MARIKNEFDPLLLERLVECGVGMCTSMGACSNARCKGTAMDSGFDDVHGDSLFGVCRLVYREFARVGAVIAW